ncbi:MAG TPA: polyphosphate kinase 1, partial [Puia sp.]|nr:polyphosphate kinase 1 [Puia sp.]
MAASSFFDRDLSWLTFNCRVLEEAAREETPLLEKIFFLSVYSSNLDEFYRVRIPAIAALQKIKATRDNYVSPQGILLLTKITNRLSAQLERFGHILTTRILPALTTHDIHFVYHNPIPPAARTATTGY